MTALVVSADARQRVDRIKTSVEVVWHLIVESYQARDWDALGYATWDEMCTREFGTSRLRLPREERAETVQSLRSAGLSLRAIAAVTGDSAPTVMRELRNSPGVSFETPEPPVVVDHSTGEVIGDEPEGWGASIEADVEASESPFVEPAPASAVTGIDGKSYSSTSSRKPPRKPLIDVAKTRGFAMRQAADSLLKVFEDDRFRANEKQVADALRGHLLYVAETVAAVLDQLP